MTVEKRLLAATARWLFAGALGRYAVERVAVRAGDGQWGVHGKLQKQLDGAG
jgi:hypothetical protein